jgi:hypothetical protein
MSPPPRRLANGLVARRLGSFREAVHRSGQLSQRLARAVIRLRPPRRASVDERIQVARPDADAPADAERGQLPSVNPVADRPGLSCRRFAASSTVR